MHAQSLLKMLFFGAGGGGGGGSDVHNLGYFINEAALLAAAPTATAGDWAIVGHDLNPASVYVWDDETDEWIDTGYLNPGDVEGPDGGVSDGEVLVSDGVTGKKLKGTGTLFSALLTNVLGAQYLTTNNYARLCSQTQQVIDLVATAPGVYELSITPVGSTFQYVSVGGSLVASAAKTLEIDTVGVANGTTYYCYIDSGGNLVSSTDPADWAITSIIPIAICKLSQSGLTFAPEDHTTALSPAMHLKWHETIGTVIEDDGLIASGYTIGTDVDADKRPDYAAGAIWDDDRRIPIAAFTGGTDGYCYLVRTDGGASADYWNFRIPTLTDDNYDPFVLDDSASIQLAYNDFVNGTMEPVTNNYYVNTYVVATFFKKTVYDAGSGNEESTAPRLCVIPGQAEYATLAEAQEESLSDLTLTGLPMEEATLLYRYTWRYKTTNTSNGGCRLWGVQEYREQIQTYTGSLSSNSHAAMNDRDLPDQHPIESITGAKFFVDLTAGVDFATTATSAYQIEVLNSDLSDTVRPGMLLKVTADGSDYYYEVDAITSSYIYVIGPDLPTGAGLITAVKYHTGDPITRIVVPLAGNWCAATGSTLIQTIMGYKLYWPKQQGRILGIKASSATANGSPVLNLVNVTTAKTQLSTGLTVTDTPTASRGDNASYADSLINKDDQLELTCTTSDTGNDGLTAVISIIAGRDI